MGLATSYPNPATASQRLVGAYHELVVSRLLQGLPDAKPGWKDALAEAVGSTGQDLDHVWFTLRQPYAQGASLHELQQNLALDDRVVGAFPLARLYRHQERALRLILSGCDTVVATGTGSGKTEAFLIPVLELCLRCRAKGVKAILIYPRNALVADQLVRLRSYAGQAELRVGRLVGLDDTEEIRRERQACLDQPPDILVTNHVMLERILTLRQYAGLRGEGSLQALVLDEAHTFRGSVASDIAWLIRRVRAACGTNPVSIGASATLGSAGGTIGDTSGDEPGLEAFIQGIFGSDDRSPAKLVLPEYDDSGWADGPPMLPIPRRWEELRLATDLSPQADDVLDGLFGFAVGPVDNAWGFLDDAPAGLAAPFAERLRQHAVVRLWRERLMAQGALGYSELVNLAADAWTQFHGVACPDALRLTAACLSGVMRANWLAGEERQPRVLDLVTHIVLREARGSLKRRLWDDSLYLGSERFCPSSGRPLFDVCRDDLAWSLAVVDPLRRVMAPEQDPASAQPGLVVRLAEAKRVDLPPDSLRISLDWSQSDSEWVGFRTDAAGSHVMALLPEAKDPARLTVEPKLSPHHLDYLEWLARELVEMEESLDGGPRLLAFGDERELVARVGYELSAARADGHLLYLATADSEEAVPLLDALRQVRAKLQSLPADDQDARELSEHVPLWFTRLCATPPRRFPQHEGLLGLGQQATAMVTDEARRLVIDAALASGCVAWREVVDLPTHDDRRLAEFDHRERTARRLLTLDPGVERVEEDVDSVPLTGETSSTWRDQVLACGAGDVVRGVAAVRAASEALVAAGVLRCYKDLLRRDGGWAVGYALEPEALVVRPDPKRILPTWRAVGIHSSETPPDQRKRYETDFRDGRTLRLLVATSTLELGIDIGALRHVLCVNLPPNPAAYAQRVGRAGRSTRGSMYALGVVWCRDDRPREMFYYTDPDELRQMLAGQVTPPPIDVDNPLVARRHLFAWALQDRLEDPARLAELADGTARGQMPEPLGRQFAKVLDVDSELANRLAPRLGKPLELDRRQLQERWFRSTLVPDYGFRHDEITLHPSTAEADDRRALSQRPPEQAVGMWYPDGVVALPQGHQRIVEGVGMKIFMFDGRPVHQWHQFLCEREQGWASGASRRPTYRIEAQLDQPDDLQWIEAGGTWIRWGVFDRSSFRLVNHGRHLGGDDQPRWGHSGPCAGLLVAYDPVLLDPTQHASLICLMDHALQRFFRLDEGELLVLHPLSPPRLDPTWLERPMVVTAWLDVAARGVIPLTRLHQHWVHLLARARRRLDECDCKDGCFRCLRTYATSRLIPDARRSAALDLVDAVLGQGALPVSVPPRPRPIDAPPNSACITLRQSQDRFLVDLDGQPFGSWATADLGPKASAFEALRQAIAAAAPRAATLRTPLDWLSSLFRGTRRELGSEERRLLFDSLRLPAMVVEE